MFQVPILFHHLTQINILRKPYLTFSLQHYEIMQTLSFYFQMQSATVVEREKFRCFGQVNGTLRHVTAILQDTSLRFADIVGYYCICRITF